MTAPAPADIEWMVRRGWPPDTLLGMTPGEFSRWLGIAVDAAKAEAEAMKQAAKR